MSMVEEVNFSPRDRADSENDEYSLEGYDPNYFGAVPTFEQFPPFKHKPKPSAGPRFLTKGKYFAFHEAPPRDLWFCEFPHCSTTFLPYLMVGMRHHCRACGISVCIHHCSRNLTISSNILPVFEGSLEDIATPVIATSMDGSTLPAVVTLKYVCLLCSARAVAASAQDKRRKKTNANSTAEADQLLLKLEAAQAALQEKGADVHSLTSSVHTVTAQMQSMQGTIQALEAQVNKNATKEYRKVQRLKQQLRALNTANERALYSTNTTTAASHTAHGAFVNTGAGLRTASVDSTSNENSNENSIIGTSDAYISDSDEESYPSNTGLHHTNYASTVGNIATAAAVMTNSTTSNAAYIASADDSTPLSPVVSPMRPIDQLYRDIVNSALFISTSASNTTTNTTTEATQTTPLSLVKPTDCTNTTSVPFSPTSNAAATAQTNGKSTNNTSRTNSTNSTNSTMANSIKLNRSSIPTVNTTQSTTIDNIPSNTNNTSASNTNDTNSSATPNTTPTTTPTLTLSVSASPSPYRNVNTPLTDNSRKTSHTSHTSASAWVEYDDIYDNTHAQDSLNEIFDPEFPEIRTVNVSGDSEDSDSGEQLEYSQLYNRGTGSGGKHRMTSNSGAYSVVSSPRGGEGCVSRVSSGYAAGASSSHSLEYDLYEPDLLDVYGTRYSSVFNLLDGEIESASVSPADAAGGV